MMEESVSGIKTEVLDHLGLVAAQCIKLKLADRIDQRLGDSGRRIVSFGKACVAMVLNGLGFTHRQLYLTPQFFESKALGQLLGEGIEAKHLHDDTLGDTLDAIAQYGASRLYAEVAFDIAVSERLLGGLTHVDTTSFSVFGAYDAHMTAQGEATDVSKDKPSTIEVTYGYSKAHRPDLKQVVLSLAACGGSGIPLWMTPCSGNASDKVVLSETVAQIEAFRRELDVQSATRYVGDSALYTAENLEKMKGVIWVSRVPENIKAAQALVNKPSKEIQWESGDDGYSMAEFESDYAGTKQRWLLVFSQQAYVREKKTFEKNVLTKEKNVTGAAEALSRECFACETDAQKAANKLAKAHPLFTLTSTVVPLEKYNRLGRPKATDTKQCIGYQVKTLIERNQPAIDVLLESKGRFILATNDLDKKGYPSAQLLREYKEQQTVERGFAFLKNPEFMADTLYLKNPKRIEALMAIMTLCLMVYNITQYQLRQTLAQTRQAIPNQLGKPSSTPTLRWVFQLMEGIACVHLWDEVAQINRSVISNLTPLRQTIIRLFGDAACLVYQIKPKIQ